MFVEFDRGNTGEEAVDILRAQVREAVATVELDVKDYAKLRHRLHDLEVQNNLLHNQVVLLKSQLTGRLGTAQDFNRQLFQQKLLETVRKETLQEVATVLACEEEREQRAEAMIEKMREGINDRKAQTYEESIVLKTLQMTTATEQEEEAATVVVVDIPARPRKEIVEEIKVLWPSTASLDDKASRGLQELLEAEQAERRKLGDMNLRLSALNKQLTQQIDALKEELRKSIFLLRNRVTLTGTDLKPIVARYQEMSPPSKAEKDTLNTGRVTAPRLVVDFPKIET